MSAQEISLESIAAELARVGTPERKMYASSGNRATERQLVDEKAPEILKTRFGEVIEAFQRLKTVVAVTRETGISEYCLRRYFFANPEFVALLRTTNEHIFLEATKSIRDTQAHFVQKAQQLAQDALDEMEELLHTSESEHIRFRVAKDLLDRDPLQRAVHTSRSQTTAVNVTIEAKTLELAMQAAGELEHAIPITPISSSSDQKEIE